MASAAHRFTPCISGIGCGSGAEYRVPDPLALPSDEILGRRVVEQLLGQPAGIIAGCRSSAGSLCHSQTAKAANSAVVLAIPVNAAVVSSSPVLKAAQSYRKCQAMPTHKLPVIATISASTNPTR